jgi:hypothetical protein
MTRKLKVDMDVTLLEKVTLTYIQELYKTCQIDIAEFIKERVNGVPADSDQWAYYDELHNDAIVLRKMLESLMEKDEYKIFVQQIYDELYPIKAPTVAYWPAETT